ncbi:hypothetical protein [Nocardioides sp. NPDC004968]|uniref:hypothetical protein n=1 Tax=Nocardioides sp. NPDC004968 TaxID=3155894 RepID=UPI0033A53E5C
MTRPVTPDATSHAPRVDWFESSPPRSWHASIPPRDDHEVRTSGRAAFAAVGGEQVDVDVLVHLGHLLAVPDPGEDKPPAESGL